MEITTDNHVERCWCWECGGHGKVSYIIRGDEEEWGHCLDCMGEGEKYRAKATQTAVVRALLTQAKNALEYIEVTDSDLDQVYTTIDGAIGDIERYERKVGTRNGN